LTLSEQIVQNFDDLMIFMNSYDDKLMTSMIMMPLYIERDENSHFDSHLKISTNAPQSLHNHRPHILSRFIENIFLFSAQ
jgi:ribonucleotide reductase beta subunit family protein with ferritin-like domain